MKIVKCCILLMIHISLIMKCAPVMIDEPDRIRTIGTLNIRSGPGINHDIITTVSKGEEVYLLDAKNDWYRVKLSEGKTGWIYRGFTKHVEYEKIIIVRRTYLYRGPGQNYETFAILVKGKTFPMRQERGNWYLIDLPDGNSGWVSKADAKKASRLNLKTKRASILREQPSENSRELMRVSVGRELIQLEKRGSWYNVKVGEGATGWIHESALSTVDEQNLTVPNEANIRRGPDLKYGIIETLPTNSKLTELAVKDDWYRVRTPSGEEGWVHNSVVRKSRTQSSISSASAAAFSSGSSSETSVETYAVPPEYVLTNQDCNIRQGYGTNFQILERVKNNTILLKIGQKDNWYRIKFPPYGNVGWILNELVKPANEILITSQECNIRQGYSTSFRIKRRAPAGLPLARIESRDNWERVYMPDGEIGWIQNDLIIYAPNVLVTNQECNIRTGPGLNYEKVGSLSTGTILKRMSQSNDWYEIQTPDKKTAWVRNDLVVALHDQFITKETTNIRQGPGTGNKLVKQVSSATRLYVTGHQSNWLEARIASGDKGWVRQDLILPTYHSGTISETYEFTSSEPTTYTPTSGRTGITQSSNGKVNIRIGPGFDYAVLVQLAPETELTKLAIEGDWYKVKTPDGIIGYIHKSVFHDTSSRKPIEKDKFYLTSNTQFRKEPNSDSQIIVTLPTATPISKISERESWAYVQLKDGRKGWIHTNDLHTYDEVTPVVTSEEIDIEYGILETNKDTDLKKSPGILKETLKRISKNTRITKYGKMNEWYQVQLSEGTIGWIIEKDVDDKTFPAMITINPTRIKLTPEASSPTLENLKVGHELYPRNENPEWYTVKTSSNEVGWVNKKDVTPMKYATIYATANSKVRRLPILRSEVITTLEEGDQLVPTKKIESWYFVTLQDGKMGWIAKAEVTEQRFPKMKVTKSTHAYVKPLISSKEVAMLREGDVFLPVEKYGEWYKIFLRGGDYGWVYDSFLEEVDRGLLLVKNDGAKIRSGKGIEYEILASVKKGIELRCFTIESNWCQVYAKQNQIGWISTSFTKDISYSPVVVIRQTPVRSGPGDSFAEISTYKENKEITPIDEQKGWYEFKFSATQKGWIKKSDCEKKAKLRTVFTLDMCDIRKGPGTSQPVVSKVDPATDLLIIGEDGNWYNVKLTDQSGITGWVKKEMVFE